MANQFLSPHFANNFQTKEKQEEAKLKTILQEHPEDIDVWLELIKQTERYVRHIQKSTEKSKQVYQEFLREFPQYHVVWRKLAEVYNQDSDQEMVLCTYEEALKFLPVNIDLWLHFCNWTALNRDPDQARSLFQRAVQAAGKVYTSNLLWDRYLEFEKQQKNYQNMESVYWQIIAQPINKLYEYFTRFKNFTDTFGKEIIADDENFEENKRRKLEGIIQTYERSVIENNKRKIHEQAIKQSTFNGKTLDQDQILNWRKYITLEESEGNPERIRLLYERCVVPTCYYSEFWTRYARWLQRTEGVESARELYKRANAKFLSRRPDLFIVQGYFEETNGNIEEARKLYKHVYQSVTPGLLDAIFKHINLERRQQDNDKVDELYQQAVEVADQNKDTEIIAQVNARYARFHYNIKGDIDRAIQIFTETLPKVANVKQFYLLFISFLQKLRESNERYDKIKWVYEFSVGPDSTLSQEDVLEMWLSYIDFMSISCRDHEEFKAVEKRFKHVFHHQSILSAKFKKFTKFAKTLVAEEPEDLPEKRLKLDDGGNQEAENQKWLP